VHHDDHEIDAVAAQRLGLRLHGWRRSAGTADPRVRHARRVVVRAPVSPIRMPSSVTMSRSLKPGERPSVGLGHVGGEQRKLRLRHALEENRLAEIELVIARHENVRLDQLVSAMMCAPWSTPTSAMATACRRHGRTPRARLGALGLDHGGEPREAAAALPSGISVRPSDRCRWSG
jgi:hypothetical protein